MDLSIVSKNIKHYRKYFNMRQEDLARKIGVSRSTIASYETQQTTPDIQTLKLIANCFGIPVNNLYTPLNFDDSATIKDFILKESNLSDLREVVFPTLCSDKALEDPMFCEAYKKHMHILKFPQETFVEDLDKVYNKYKESLEVNGTVDSAGNMVAIIFTIFSANFMDERVINLTEELLNKGFVDSKGIKMHLMQSESKSSNEEKKQFYFDTKDEYLRLLRILRKSIKQRNFADFYFALQYMLGYVENDYDSETNQMIFFELITSYAEIGNKYARNYKKVFCEIWS